MHLFNLQSMRSAVFEFLIATNLLIQKPWQVFSSIDHPTILGYESTPFALRTDDAYDADRGWIPWPAHLSYGKVSNAIHRA